MALGTLSTRAAYVLTDVGFVEGALNDVGEAFRRWQPRYHAVPVEGTLDDLLNRLNPLNDRVIPRRIFIAAGSWSAYVDCLAGRNDSKGVCRVLSKLMRTRALALDFSPEEPPCKDLPSQLPGVQMQIFDGKTARVGAPYLRVIAAVLDGDRWVFDQSGEIQDFEDVANYTKRRIRDRFTVEMLDRYCRVLGVRLFDHDFYGPEAILMESDISHPDAMEYRV